MKPLPRGKIRWRDIYRWGGILRRDIGAMGLFEFHCAVDGWLETHGGKPKRSGMSATRARKLGIAGFD